jgi:hypothetical protein
MATRFYYPTFKTKVAELAEFLHKHQADMVRLNSISDPQLTELNTLGTALAAIDKGAGWPKYEEQP